MVSPHQRYRYAYRSSGVRLRPVDKGGALATCVYYCSDMPPPPPPLLLLLLLPSSGEFVVSC